MVSNKPSTRSVWDRFWHGFTPEGEIRMWDFYGGRPWVLKHTPRHGKVLEAGCGLGRYVFYLSQLGIDIEGLDFHEPTVLGVHQWGAKQGLEGRFIAGDVAKLPYDSESMSGYLSLGVIEHFQEGPRAALAEAWRVLRPGGVAVISTPAISFAQTYFRISRWAKDTIKRLIRRPRAQPSFFQYWYAPRQLRAFVEAVGLNVVLDGACDLKYAFWELGAHSDRWFRIADWLERTPFAEWGALAFTVSVKIADQMHCFLCGRKNTRPEQLQRYYLPVCVDCSSLPIARYYLCKAKPQFQGHWEYDPPVLRESNSERHCYFCKQRVLTDALFEDFGFAVPICQECLRTPARNLLICNEYLQPRWRPRGS